MNERLWEIYEELCQIEMRPVEEFVRRVLSAEFGEFPAEDVIELLREIQSNVMASIQNKAMESPRYAEMADQVAEDTQQMFDDLIAEVEQAS